MMASVRYIIFTMWPTNIFPNCRIANTHCQVSKLEMSVFGFEILGLKPRNILEFEPKKKSTSKSGFELYSAICNCWLRELSRQPNPKLNSDFSVIAEPNLRVWIENWKQNAGLKISVSNSKLMLDFSGFQTRTWKQPFLVYFNRPNICQLLRRPWPERRKVLERREESRFLVAVFVIDL